MFVICHYLCRETRHTLISLYCRWQIGRSPYMALLNFNMYAQGITLLKIYKQELPVEDVETGS